MRKLVILFSLIFNSYCYCNELKFDEKIYKFDVNLTILNGLTKKFNEKNNLFIDRKYLKYSLYRSLILNSLFINNKSYELTKEIFCSESHDNMGKLLKWKISMQYTMLELENHDITCKEVIEKSKLVMDNYFLNIKFSDAYMEYFLYMKNAKDTDILFLNGLLKNSIQGFPNIKISEYLIENKKQIVKKYKEKYDDVNNHPVWNASVIAALQGSNKGLENMKELLLDNELHVDFITKVIRLNAQRLDSIREEL